MSAGSVPPPQIIPLRVNGKSKTNIDSNTYISLNCNYPEAHSIFFTADGSKPAVKIVEGGRLKGPHIRMKPDTNSTLKYDKPFLVSNGRRTIRAVAISHIDGRESNINSKVFHVAHVDPDTSEYEESLDNEDSYEDNASNFKLDLNDRKNLRDQWGNSFNFQPTQSVGVPQNFSQPNTLQLYNPNVIYANPNALTFGGGAPTVLSHAQGSQIAFNDPYKDQTLYAQKQTDLTRERVLRNRGTQTVGLFYPGGKRVNQETAKLMEEMEIQKRNSGNQQPLTPISVGKGFWRRQMEHVTDHMKRYASDNLEFRAGWIRC